MNRRERRAAGAPNFPPGYVEQIQDMGKSVHAYMRVYPDARPSFALPPTECMFVAPLSDMIDRVCLNEHARVIAAALIADVPAAREPTVFMLGVALEHGGLRHTVQRLPLEHFTAGFERVVMSRGGDS